MTDIASRIDVFPRPAASPGAGGSCAFHTLFTGVPRS
jgi:hypothetical protein